MRHCSCRRLRSLHAFPSRVQSRALAHHAGLEVPAGSTRQRTEKGSVQHQHLIVLFVLHYCKQEKWVLFASGKAEMKEWRSGGVTEQPINSGMVKSDGCTARKQWNTIVSMPFLSEHPNQRKKHAELVQFLWGKKWCLPISFKRNILQMCSPKSQADVTAIEKAIQKAPICSKTPDSLCLCHSAPWLHCSEHCTSCTLLILPSLPAHTFVFTLRSSLSRLRRGAHHASLLMEQRGILPQPPSSHPPVCCCGSNTSCGLHPTPLPPNFCLISWCDFRPQAKIMCFR